jgi:hypothetical protein
MVFELTLSFRCSLLIDPKEQSPELEVFLSGQPDSLTTLRRGETHVTLRGTGNEGALIGVDLFTFLQNDEGRYCRLRSAYASLDVSTCLSEGFECTLPFHNRCDTNIFKGRVDVKVLRHKGECEPLAVETLARTLSKCITKSVALFDNHRLQPKEAHWSRILAPVYQTRTMAVPGIAFWMHEVEFTEEGALHLLQIALHRHGLTEVDFLERSVVDTASVLASFCTIYPASLPYTSDVYAQGNRFHPYESFDDLMVRNAGDCEDFSRAMCSIFNAVRWSGRKWEGALLKKLHHLSTYYIAVSALSVVTSASYTAGCEGGGGTAAHMYVKYVPRIHFYQMAGMAGSFEDWEGQLSIYIGEGTSHVRCDVSTAYPLEQTLSTKCEQLPAGYEREACPSFQDGGLSFYKHDLHWYTDYFFRRWKDKPAPGVFTLQYKDKDTYGVTFRDTIQAWNKIQLRPHPAFSVQERKWMSQVVQLEHPSPVFQKPVQDAPERLGQRRLIGTRADGDGDEGTIVDFFCSTPRASPPFSRLLRSLHPLSISICRETFCPTSPPIVRIRLRLPEE